MQIGPKRRTNNFSARLEVIDFKIFRFEFFIFAKKNVIVAKKKIVRESEESF